MRKMLSAKTHLEVSLANVKKGFSGMEKYVLVSRNLCKFDQLKTFPTLLFLLKRIHPYKYHYVFSSL